MKILLETAALDVIRWAFDAQLADGVFVTPAALDADAYGVGIADQTEAIARAMDGNVFVAASALAADDLHRNGRELGRMGDQIVVALPFVEDGIVALRRLERDGVRTAALFVVSAAQAVLAAKTGASYVCIATDHLESHGQDSGAVLRDTRTLFDRHGVECEIVAVAGSYTRLVTAGLVAGADAVSVRPDALRSLIGHPMTDRAVDQMLGEFSRRPRADHA